MATWALAVAFSTRPEDPGDYSFPQALVEWIEVEGGGLGGVTEGFATFAEALGKMMADGWEPFSAHRWEDFDAYGSHPLKSTGSLPIRDYVWFRKPQKSRTLQPKRDVSVTEAQLIKPRAGIGG